MAQDAGTPQSSGNYMVVARRYRPQTFSELIGQEHVAQALTGAITADRVGHAYLFTGARGVGKTSAARILAKALDCVHGPTPTPCNECDICRGISSGDDVDVLEIDGASNRGIDEIRELRQKVNVRPSRARYKIYIIDEVHMLTREAFNALLKTLEEPPDHVKFIFCTTEVEKIPITILSRCQRFDFAGIAPTSIMGRLRQIVDNEGVQVEPEALEMIARRAAGSMRDSQSLLEQLLAACPERITVADLHRLLGTAGEQRLGELVGALIRGDAARALQLTDAAAAEGVDLGLLVDQLLGYFRDLMVAAIGAGPDNFLYVTTAGRNEATSLAKQFGLEAILAAMQIIDHTLARLRSSTHIRTLTELALVRIARLEDLARVGDWIAALNEGQTPTLAAPSPTATASRPLAAPQVSSGEPALKKNAETVAVGDATTVGDPEPVDATAATTPSTQPAAAAVSASGMEILQQAVQRLDGMTAQGAGLAVDAAILAPNRLAVRFPEQYTFWKAYCEKPAALSALEQAIAAVAGRNLKVEFEIIPDVRAARGPEAASEPVRKNAREMLFEKAQDPFVRKALELFRARPERFEPSSG